MFTFKTLHAKKRILFWVVTFLIWSLFIFIWSRWGDARLLTGEWFFDLGGHALAGFVLGLNVLFYFRNYRHKDRDFCQLEFSYQGKLARARVLELAVWWEVVEGVLDIYRTSFNLDVYPAQTHILDTTADILICLLCSFPAVYVYEKGVGWYEERFKAELPRVHQDQLWREAKELGEALARKIKLAAQDKNEEKLIRNSVKRGMNGVFRAVRYHETKRRETA